MTKPYDVTKNPKFAAPPSFALIPDDAPSCDGSTEQDPRPRPRRLGSYDAAATVGLVVVRVDTALPSVGVGPYLLPTAGRHWLLLSPDEIKNLDKNLVSDEAREVVASATRRYIRLCEQYLRKNNLEFPDRIEHDLDRVCMSVFSIIEGDRLRGDPPFEPGFILAYAPMRSLPVPVNATTQATAQSSATLDTLQAIREQGAALLALAAEMRSLRETTKAAR